MKYGLDDTLNFGKYNGKTIFQVITTDCNYLIWALKNVAFFELDKSANRMLNEKIDFIYNEGYDDGRDDWRDGYDTYRYGKND